MQNDTEATISAVTRRLREAEGEDFVRDLARGIAPPLPAGGAANTAQQQPNTRLPSIDGTAHHYIGRAKSISTRARFGKFSVQDILALDLERSIYDMYATNNAPSYNDLSRLAASALALSISST